MYQFPFRPIRSLAVIPPIASILIIMLDFLMKHTDPGVVESFLLASLLSNNANRGGAPLPATSLDYCIDYI